MKSFDLQKETIESELRNSNCDQKKFEFKSVWNQILNLQKHVSVGYLDRGDHNEEVGVGFIGFGQTVEKLWGFEDQGLICKIKLQIGPLQKTIIKRKILSNERSLSELNERNRSYKKLTGERSLISEP